MSLRPPGANERKLYADGERMMIVTRGGYSDYSAVISMSGFDVGALSFRQDVQDIGGLVDGFPGSFVAARWLEFEIKSRGPVVWTEVPAGADDPAADFLPASVLTIEQLLAIVHRKMRDRGEDLGDALARLPAA